MDTTLFTQLLETYGSDFKRWPKEHVAAAQTLLAAQPSLQALYAREQAFDQTLQNWRIDVPSDFLSTLKTKLEDSIETETFKTLWRPFTPKIAALTFALILGFVFSFVDQSYNNEEAIYFDQITLDLNSDIETDS